MSKISMIIPCYNVEHQIGRCLDSVFAQTLGRESLEVICVDDCSTDRTVELLREYERQYPDNLMLVLLPENGKQGKARNIGMQYASGDYITFVDADDCIAPQMLEELLRCSEEYGNDVTECGFQIFTDRIPEVAQEGERLHFHMDRLEDKKAYILGRARKTGPWGRLYRRDFLIDHGIYFPEGIFMEDICFSRECMMYMKEYIYLPQTYYFYYINLQGTMYGEKAAAYYMDSACVQDRATELLRARHWYDDCMEEYAALHFRCAFGEPIAAMFKNKQLFSYENYQTLRRNLLSYFPNIAANRYLQEGKDLAPICLQFAAYALTEEQLRYIIVGQQGE